MGYLQTRNAKSKKRWWFCRCGTSKRKKKWAICRRGTSKRKKKWAICRRGTLKAKCDSSFEDAEQAIIKGNGLSAGAEC